MTNMRYAFSSFLLYSQGGNQTHKDTEKDKDTGKHKDKEHRRIETTME